MSANWLEMTAATFDPDVPDQQLALDVDIADDIGTPSLFADEEPTP